MTHSFTSESTYIPKPLKATYSKGHELSILFIKFERGGKVIVIKRMPRMAMEEDFVKDALKP